TSPATGLLMIFWLGRKMIYQKSRCFVIRA
ncbi:hypothetical protein ABH927_002908, partial [Planotetraspora sp. GP83]